MSHLATISRLSVENFLSLQKLDLPFSSLNVLVGPNGAGKTNILKVFQFLGDIARQDLIPAIDAFGGFENLTFRGAARGTARKDSLPRTIRIHLTGSITKYASPNAPDEYKLAFWQRSFRGPSSTEPRIHRMVQRQEQILIKRTAGRGRRITLKGNSVKLERIGRESQPAITLSVQGASTGLATLRRLGSEYEAAQVEELAQVFEQLRLFEIDVESIRRPSQIIDPHRLRPDGANLAPFLLWLKDEHESTFERICDDVRFVLPGFRDFSFVNVGGSDNALRLDIREEHLSGTTPLARASFGTIRSIALFAMLHDPEPPKLTCIEEIDHGLHPHALDRLVDRLREAAERTQIILATHSPALVNRLDPRELIIVERDEGTGSTRAVKPDLAMVQQLQKETGYELGELWFSGSLGGAL